MKAATAIEKAEGEAKASHEKWEANPSPYLFEQWQKAEKKVKKLKAKLKGTQTELPWQNR